MGMKANELRMGNLVGHNNPNLDPKYLTVYSIGETGINFWPNTDEPAASKIEFETLEPIPLTPEILEKAGFIKESGAYIIQLDDNGNHLSFVKNDNGFVCLSHTVNYVFKYLHQLQNLYFALTGEELEVNL